MASGVAAALGFALLDRADPAVLAAITAVAGGAILALLADTMIPEAFEEGGHWPECDGGAATTVRLEMADCVPTSSTPWRICP